MSPCSRGKLPKKSRFSTYGSAGATSPKVKITRGPGASIGVIHQRSDVNVAPVVEWTGGPGFGDATLVQVDVKYTWNAVLGGRLRSETSSTIVAAGTEK